MGMIERAARAMCRQVEADLNAAGVVVCEASWLESPDAYVDTHWTEYVRQARAALGAIQDITDEMEDAADEPFHAILQAETERSIRRHGKPAYASAAFSGPLFRAMMAVVVNEQIPGIDNPASA